MFHWYDPTGVRVCFIWGLIMNITCTLAGDIVSMVCKKAYSVLSDQLIFWPILTNQLNFMISVHISNYLELSSNLSNQLAPFRPSIKLMGRFVYIEKTRESGYNYNKLFLVLTTYEENV